LKETELASIYSCNDVANQATITKQVYFIRKKLKSMKMNYRVSCTENKTSETIVKFPAAVN